MAGFAAAQRQGQFTCRDGPADIAGEARFFYRSGKVSFCLDKAKTHTPGQFAFTRPKPFKRSVKIIA